MKREAGFTLIELIVAVTVLTGGLLALVATNALIIRTLGASDRAATATFYAHERLESLRATGCGALASGSETRENVYELSWDAAPTNNGNAGRVLLTVTYPSVPGSIRTDSVDTSVLCVR